MDWAGIDIRYGGNPVISHNTIINGKSDGIVVGAGGKSIIFDNDLIGKGLGLLFSFPQQPTSFPTYQLIFQVLLIILF